MKTRKFKLTGWQLVKRELIVEILVLDTDTEDDLLAEAFKLANKTRVEATKIVNNCDYIEWDEIVDV